MTLRIDEVGYWSEIKLDIVREYAQAYSSIMSKQKRTIKSYAYIDAFAGAGKHISRSTGEFIPGSPLNALHIKPEFNEYYFIDINRTRVQELLNMSKERANVHVYEGDCNELILNKVFPKVRYTDYRRGLCLLDPYGLHLDWKVIHEAGKMGSIEVFLNFPLADMNRNVLWNQPERVDLKQKERMTRFWGDETWQNIAYDDTQNLFRIPEKTDNETIAQAFKERLKKIAGFNHVLDPMPMKNSNRAIIYYLYFASPNTTGSKIVQDIFKKYRDRV